MLGTVIRDWTHWNSDGVDERSEVYEKWKNNLDLALRNDKVINGEIGLNLPSTNYKTYIVKKNGKIYVDTANNHQWDLDDVIDRGGGADEGCEDQPHNLMKNYNFINVRNNIVHSS